jgi:hypothetical protein
MTIGGMTGIDPKFSGLTAIGTGRVDEFHLEIQKQVAEL